MERVVILGASRGLGAALAQYVCSTTSHSVIGVGRRELPLRSLRDRFPRHFLYRIADFSTRQGQDETLEYLLAGQPTKVFYMAGGGAHGHYHQRAWRDHQWAWEVTFLFAARMIHCLLAAELRPQLILVGSAVAENAGDPLAASYCAAKHALRGLYYSLRGEYPDWNLRLFSPGYMDTDLLPRHAAPRQRGVFDPAQLAVDLWSWSLTADIGGHKVYPTHPSAIAEKP